MTFPNHVFENYGYKFNTFKTFRFHEPLNHFNVVSQIKIHPFENNLVTIVNCKLYNCITFQFHELIPHGFLNHIFEANHYYKFNKSWIFIFQHVIFKTLLNQFIADFTLSWIFDVMRWLQILHLYGTYVSWSTSIWFSNSFFRVKQLLKMEHLYDFSRSWLWTDSTCFSTSCFENYDYKLNKLQG